MGFLLPTGKFIAASLLVSELTFFRTDYKVQVSCFYYSAVSRFLPQMFLLQQQSLKCALWELGPELQLI